MTSRSKIKAQDPIDVLEGLTVEYLDRELVKTTRKWKLLYRNRQAVAEDEGVTTPSPAIAMLDDLLGRDTRPALPAPSFAAAMAATCENKDQTTWASLADQYRSDERSPYHMIRFATRKYYDNLMQRLVKERGSELLANLNASDIEAIYEGWTSGGKMSMAHALMVMVRTLINFGDTILKNEQCERLALAVHRIRSATTIPSPREPQRATEQLLTADDVVAIRKHAHSMDLHSVALAQALHFECHDLHQKDVIGEWVPKDEPVESKVETKDRKGRPIKWVRGLRWEEIDVNWILRHPTSRRQRVIEIDLKNAPMVMEELALIERLSDGPIIKDNGTGIPYARGMFRAIWRKVADAAGISKDVTSTDGRAGGNTVAGGNGSRYRSPEYREDAKTERATESDLLSVARH